MNCRIFYSWQSDSPGATNRGLIEDSLELAVRAIKDDGSLKVEAVIDRDTSGVAGSPDISNTIFRKISESHIFLGDVTIINKGTRLRQTPNPNVLVELGYAMHALGASRIVMVLNTAFGSPERLPFDLRLRRIVTYVSEPADTDRSLARKDLAKKLERQLRLILSELEAAYPAGDKTSANESSAAESTALRRQLTELSPRVLTSEQSAIIGRHLRPLVEKEKLRSKTGASVNIHVDPGGGCGDCGPYAYQFETLFRDLGFRIMNTSLTQYMDDQTGEYDDYRYGITIRRDSEWYNRIGAQTFGDVFARALDECQIKARILERKGSFFDLIIGYKERD